MLVYNECSSWQSTLSMQSVSLFLFFFFPSTGFDLLFFSFFPSVSLPLCLQRLFGWCKERELWQLSVYRWGKGKKVIQAVSFTHLWDIQLKGYTEVQTLKVLCLLVCVCVCVSIVFGGKCKVVLTAALVGIFNHFLFAALKTFSWIEAFLFRDLKS